MLCSIQNTFQPFFAKNDEKMKSKQMFDWKFPAVKTSRQK